MPYFKIVGQQYDLRQEALDDIQKRLEEREGIERKYGRKIEVVSLYLYEERGNFRGEAEYRLLAGGKGNGKEGLEALTLSRDVIYSEPASSKAEVQRQIEAGVLREKGRKSDRLVTIVEDVLHEKYVAFAELDRKVNSDRWREQHRDDEIREKERRMPKEELTWQEEYAIDSLSGGNPAARESFREVMRDKYLRT